VVEVLRNEPLDDSNGIQECERAIKKLNELVKLKFDDGMDGLLPVGFVVQLDNLH
jgi:hypothetical protein